MSQGQTAAENICTDVTAETFKRCHQFLSVKHQKTVKTSHHNLLKPTPSNVRQTLKTCRVSGFSSVNHDKETLEHLERSSHVENFRGRHTKRSEVWSEFSRRAATEALFHKPTPSDVVLSHKQPRTQKYCVYNRSSSNLILLLAPVSLQLEPNRPTQVHIKHNVIEMSNQQSTTQRFKTVNVSKTK